MEKHTNSMFEFSQSLGSDLSSSNSMAYNSRYSAITLNRSLLSTKYMEEGIVQVLIDQPVDDAFRGGIKIHTEELSADELKELQSAIEEDEVLQTYAQGLKWSRLFGGAGIIINAGQDMRQEFNIESIKKDTPLKFYAADRWELSYAPYGMNALDQFEQDTQKMTTEHPYNYYGHVIHKSNLIKLNGKLPPSLLRGQFGGWGMSELEKIVRSYNQYIKHQNVTYELLDEAKVDVMKISGFNSAIATSKGAQQTAQRVGYATQIKNFQNALVIDKEDDYEQKQINFSGLSEVLTQIRIGLACDLRMPMTKLFGISPSGLNASGEEEIENYNSMVDTEIRSKVKAGLIMIIKIMCKKLFDYIPEKLSFEWHPLREQSAQQVSAIKTENLNRVVIAFTNGLMTSDKAVQELNADKVFELDLAENEALDLEEVSNISSSTVGDLAKPARIRGF
jgi:phage-related protein (TIGR01555 family)